MSLAPLYQNGIVDYLTGKGAPPAITAFYLDLYDGDPLVDGESVLEAITGSATRTDQSANMSAAVDGVSSNTAEIEIATTSASTVTVVYIAFFTEATGGNLICFNTLTVPQLVTAGNGVTIPAGQAQINQV
jgi:hypothetical protein